MAEYIEREAISEEIRKYYYKNPPNFSYGEGFDRGLDRAQRAILDAPAADVAPVRHGRWICKYDQKYGVTYITCSRCRDIRSIDGCYEGINGESIFDQENYCPNCGAKMDGGHDG